MLTVFMDVPITRRKRYIMVTNEAGEVIHRCKFMFQLVRWMDGEGQEEYLFALEGGEPVLQVQRLHGLQEQR